jgi:hypothetical protein
MSITINHQTNSLTVTALASGAISAGSPVVINGEGTVSAVGLAGPTYGTQQLFNGTTTQDSATCFNTKDNSIITVWKDTGVIKARVGTVLGTTVTYGTVVTIDTGNLANQLACCYVPDINGFIVAVTNSSATTTRLYACTISGTTITVGSPLTSPVASAYISLDFDTSASKVVYLVNTSAYTATVSGTTITLAGSATTITTASSRNIFVKYHPTLNKSFVLVSGNGVYLQSGTLSGSTITWDTAYYVGGDGNSAGYFDPIIGTNNVAVTIANFSGNATSQIVNFTSTPFSGATTVWGTNTFYNTTATYDQYSGGIVVVYQNISGNGVRRFATVTGTTVNTFNTEADVYAGTLQFVSSIYASGIKKTIITAQVNPLSSAGYVFVLQPNQVSTYTGTNFIGINSSTVSSGAIANIALSGQIATGLSGLTTGSQYYVQTNGTITTTPGSPVVLAGTAISSSSLIVGSASVSDSTKLSTSGGTISGALTVTGDLNVNGTTTTINSSTLSVDDKNIELGSVPASNVVVTGNVTAGSAVVTNLSSTTGIIVGQTLNTLTNSGTVTSPLFPQVLSIDSATQITLTAALTGTGSATAATLTIFGYNDTTANGGGITLKGVTDKTIIWDSTNANWTSSENWNIASGKVFKIANTSVLSASALGTGVTGSSLTSVGTIGTGVWQGTAIGATYGGTGVNNGSNTITLGGNLTTSGAFATTLTVTAVTNVTLPTSGTLVNTGVTTLSSLVSVGTITTGTWSGGFGAVSGANLTSLTAGNLSGTIPSAVLGNSTHFIGTTSIALNRASGSQALTGITSIDGSAASVANAITFNNAGTGDASGTTYNGSVARTISYNTVGAPAYAQVAGSNFDFNTVFPATTTLNRVVWNTGDGNMLNSPNGNSTGVLLASQGSHALWNAQMFFEQGSAGSMFIRGSDDASGTRVWGAWKKIVSSTNYTDYTVTKTGTGASGTWGISITGNAANVTGTVAVANGGTGVTSSTGTGSVVLSAGPTFTGTVNAANLTLSGDLTVNGTTTTINSTTVSVDDKNLELGSVASPTNTTADNGGITLKGTTDKTITWNIATGAWTSSEHIALAAGKTQIFNGATSGTITLSPTAVAGTTTLTLPATTGTLVTTGDTGTVSTTMLATVNSNVGSFGSASAVPVLTVNAKGLITAVSTTAITAVNLSGGTVNATTITGSNNASINSITVGRGGFNASGNTAVGENALTLNTASYGNTAIGYQTLYYGAAGGSHTAIGYQALGGNFSAISPTTAVGYQALSAALTSGGNNAFGYRALQLTTDGGVNSAFGNEAARYNTTGSDNVAIGWFALTYNTTGNYNTLVGTEAGYGNSGTTIVTGNSGLGWHALYLNTSGTYNSVLGYNSGSGITTGSKNTIIGSYTGATGPISATGSNFVVLSDGDGNVRETWNSSGALGVGTSPSYGTAGQVLTSAGSGAAPTWAAVSSLPTQTSNAGKFLTTDGTTASWTSTTAAAGGAIYANTTTISTTYTIPAGSNGFSVGPITVANGTTVTVSSGQRWVIL